MLAAPANSEVLRAPRKGYESAWRWGGWGDRDWPLVPFFHL